MICVEILVLILSMALRKSRLFLGCSPHLEKVGDGGEVLEPLVCDEDEPDSLGEFTASPSPHPLCVHGVLLPVQLGLLQRSSSSRPSSPRRCAHFVVVPLFLIPVYRFTRPSSACARAPPQRTQTYRSPGQLVLGGYCCMLISVASMSTSRGSPLLSGLGGGRRLVPRRGGGSDGLLRPVPRRRLRGDGVLLEVELPGFRGHGEARRDVLGSFTSISASRARQRSPGLLAAPQPLQPGTLLRVPVALSLSQFGQNSRLWGRLGRARGGSNHSALPYTSLGARPPLPDSKISEFAGEFPRKCPFFSSPGRAAGRGKGSPRNPRGAQKAREPQAIMSDYGRDDYERRDRERSYDRYDRSPPRRSYDDRDR